MQSLHWYKALQAVLPNSLTSLVLVELQSGHSTPSWGMENFLSGGAMPYSLSFRFPSSLIQSVVQQGDSWLMIFTFL